MFWPDPVQTFWTGAQIGIAADFVAYTNITAHWISGIKAFPSRGIVHMHSGSRIGVIGMIFIHALILIWAAWNLPKQYPAAMKHRYPKTVMASPLYYLVNT